VSTKKSLPVNRNQQYALFLKGIQLCGFGMQDSRTTQDRGAYVALLSKNRLTRRISTEYHLMEVTKDSFNASAKLSLSMEDKANPASRAVLVECTYIAHFHCDGCEITKDLAERFTKSELRIVVWPYFRQFVNDATSRMAIQTIVIPFSAIS
jgi:preprotein translocase subunit SecB